MQFLISKVISADPKAQEHFYKQFSRPLFVVCMRYLSNEADAGEVLNTAFYKIFNSLHKVEYINEKALFGWMRKITVNEALMFLRQRKNVQFVDESFIPADEIAPCAEITLSEQDCMIMLMRLPEGYRTVFNLYVIEGYSHQEIADMLSVSEATSRSKLLRAREYLKKLLAKTTI